jgi:hypothetical protein
MRTTESAAEFTTHRRKPRSASTRVSTSGACSGMGWVGFVEEHGEQLAPYFVRASREMDYCRLPL